MTKSKGVDAGRAQYLASRGRSKTPTDEALVRTATGRGELLHRADNGDKAARDLLIRHGHGEQFDRGGGDAA